MERLGLYRAQACGLCAAQERQPGCTGRRRHAAAKGQADSHLLRERNDLGLGCCCHDSDADHCCLQYGDSITWLDLYEGVIAKALKAGAGTKDLNVTLIDQGINGGTVTDLVVGYSPWGHLDPHRPQSNISFAETVARDKPDIIAVQIGENDVMQQPSRGEDVTVYSEVLREKIVKVAKASGAKVYLGAA